MNFKKVIDVKKILAFILIASFLLRLAIAVQPLDTLIKKIIVDDAFYGFETAKNIARGFISHNGYEPTNGVQPLWLLMVSQFFNFGDGVQLALIASAFIDTATVFLVYGISRKIFSKKISLAAAAIYGLNPIIAMTAISGIDVILAVFMVALIFYNYLHGKNFFVLGFLLGLGLLTRADILFLAVPIIFSVFLKNKRAGILVFLVAVIVYSPWLVWSYANFGTIQQSSGIANYEMGHDFYEEPRPSYLTQEFFSRSAGNFAKMSALAFHYFGAIDFSLYSFAIAGAVLLFSFFGVLSSKKYFFAPAVYALLLISFYSFYLWSFGLRYTAPLAIFISIALAGGIFFILEKFKFGKFFVAAVIIFVLGFSYNGMQQWEKGYMPWQATVLDEVDWIKKNTSPEDVIGSFNSGLMTFFSEREVVNLDGIMNFKAIDAIRERKVLDYIKSENVSYWVDMDFFDYDIYENNLAGKDFDILSETRWANVLGQGKESLNLLEKRFYTYKNTVGKNITIVMFVFKVGE